VDWAIGIVTAYLSKGDLLELRVTLRPVFWALAACISRKAAKTQSNAKKRISEEVLSAVLCGYGMR
jgi:hypothetical protein